MSQRLAPIMFNGYDPGFGKATYRDIGGPEGYLATRTDFKGNSMSGETNSDGVYFVKSYNTVIAEAHPDGTLIFNDAKYSHTTTRHQHLCHTWLARK